MFNEFKHVGCLMNFAKYQQHLVLGIQKYQTQIV
jgi:hypothetical protein